MVPLHNINAALNALGKKADFFEASKPPITGFITCVLSHKIDGELTHFIGANPENIEGVAIEYFLLSEVMVFTTTDER